MNKYLINLVKHVLKWYQMLINFHNYQINWLNRETVHWKILIQLFNQYLIVMFVPHRHLYIHQLIKNVSPVLINIHFIIYKNFNVKTVKNMIKLINHVQDKFQDSKWMYKIFMELFLDEIDLFRIYYTNNFII
jgi:hypothetical protein